MGLWSRKRAFSCALALLIASTLNAGTLSQTTRLLSQKQWSAAESSALAILKTAPKDPDAQAMLGMALYHQERFLASIAALQLALTGKTEYEPRVLYYLGIAYSKVKQVHPASDAFSRLLATYPDSPEARRINGLSADVTVQAARRVTMDMSGTVVSAEVGYDTNPDLVDDGDGDLLLSLYAYSEFRFRSIPRLIGASLLAEKYLDLTENDFVQLAISANDQFRIMNKDRIAWSVEISQSFLEFQTFERELTAMVEHTHPWNRSWISDSRAILTAVDGDDAGYDGSKAQLRLRLYKSMRDTTYLKRIRLKTRLYVNNRDNDLISFESLLLGVDCRLAMPFNTSLDLGIGLESREYNGADPVTLQTRKDDSIELSAYAVKPIDRNRNLTCQAIYTTRDSNETFYSANEIQLLLGILWIR